MSAQASHACPHCGAAIAAGVPLCLSCGHGLEPDPYSGKVLLGKYRCIERLASGHTSHVYRVQHARLGVFRAMKILRPELKNDPRAVEAFWREAHIVARVRSLNVVALHDVDALPDATPCSIWELVEGPSLADRVSRTPLGPDTSRMALGLVHALSGFHERGYAHLDLCPQNVLLGSGERGGEAHLIGFGHAREEGAPAGRSSEDLRPGYSAPEQVLGSGPIDARADLFALGAVICFAYTGQPPLASPSLTTYAEWLRRLDPARLKSLDPLPPALRAVVEHCLAPDPAARPQNAEALKEEVKRIARELLPEKAREITAMASGSYSPGPAPSTRSRTSAAAITADSLDTNKEPIAEPPAPAAGALATVVPGRAPVAPTLPSMAPEPLPHEVSADVLLADRNSTNPLGPEGTPVLPPAGRGVHPVARIEPLAGLERKTRVEFGALASIGRSSTNTVVLDHPTVSKHHAQIRFESGGYVFEDLGSRNGSSVAGKRVNEPMPIKDGDKLVLGEVVVRFRLGKAG